MNPNFTGYSCSMARGYFGEDTYTTPESGNSFKRWLLRDNWFYFLTSYLEIVIRTRKLALKGFYDDAVWAESSVDIFRLIERTGGIFEIEGMENIDKIDAPVVFVSNHMSTLETMIFPGLIAPRRRVTFVVKDSLVKHPLFGPVMRSREPIVVGRKDPRKDFEAVMNQGPVLLSQGISLIIFPQSTRSNEFKPEEFNSLGIKLAKKADVYIVPVAIKTDFWGNGRVVKEIGKLDHTKRIHIKFGEPFKISGTGREENQKIIEFIMDHLNKWGA